MPSDEQAFFARIKALVIGRTLHHYYQDKDALLIDRVRRRMAVTGLDAAGYLALLGDDEAVEWVDLEAEITIGETFFFRFAEQFAALSRRILPALLEARATTRTLRIWSAGCSTGAEPYSVAILLHRLLGPALEDWSISIVGTDISETALAAARVGEFGGWALRSLSPDEIARDFVPVAGANGRRWSLRPAYRAMVRFERRNLLALLDPTTLDGGRPLAHPFDLVLCRNVLIYFHADRVQALVRRFGDSLAQDGWLLLGHAEAVGFETRGLRAVTLDGAVAWQRADVAVAMPAGMATDAPLAPFGAARATRPPAAWKTRPPAAWQTRPPAAGARTDRLVMAPPVSLAADAAAASIEAVRERADRGLPDEALAECRAALERHPLSAELFFYAALLQRALDRDVAAEADFRRAIYLRKTFVMAHYHLGLLLNDDGRPALGRRSVLEAARIAGTLPADGLLACGDGMTAARLLDLSRREWHPARETA